MRRRYIMGMAQLFGQTVTPLGMFITGAWVYHRYMLAYSGDAPAAAAEAVTLVPRGGSWWWRGHSRLVWWE